VVRPGEEGLLCCGSASLGRPSNVPYAITVYISQQAVEPAATRK